VRHGSLVAAAAGGRRERDGEDDVRPSEPADARTLRNVEDTPDVRAAKRQSQLTERL
jgi:hypothetical protein